MVGFFTVRISLSNLMMLNRKYNGRLGDVAVRILLVTLAVFLWFSTQAPPPPVLLSGLFAKAKTSSSTNQQSRGTATQFPISEEHHNPIPVQEYLSDKHRSSGAGNGSERVSKRVASVWLHHTGENRSRFVSSGNLKSRCGSDVLLWNCVLRT